MYPSIAAIDPNCSCDLLLSMVDPYAGILNVTLYQVDKLTLWNKMGEKNMSSK